MERENEISEVEIRAFLNNEISDGVQADRIALYLDSHPDILDKYLDTDLESYKPAPGFDEVKEQVKFFVMKATKPRARVQRLVRFAAAASVLLFVVLSFFHFGNKYSDKRVPAGIASISIVNRSGKDSSLFLADSSFVILSRASQIIISSDFRLNRNVVLRGDAFFKVAKDKLHPFVVHSGGVKTQAVGTEFWVRTKNAKSLTVELLEGKVRISGYITHSPAKETYLNAGQQFTYTYEPKSVVVGKIGNPPVIEEQSSSPTSSHLHKVSTPVRTELTTNNWTNNYFQTNRATLTSLFNKIEEQHHVVIIYRKEDVENIRFTGKIMYKDQPATILELVCRLNDLTYTIKSDSIFIKPLNKSFEDEEPVH